MSVSEKFAKTVQTPGVPPLSLSQSNAGLKTKAYGNAKPTSANLNAANPVAMIPDPAMADAAYAANATGGVTIDIIPK